MASLVQWTGISYDNKPYPAWAEFFGWLLAIASMIMIPTFAIIQYFSSSQEGSFGSVSVLFSLMVEPPFYFNPCVICFQYSN